MVSFPDPERIERDLLHDLAAFRNARVLEAGFGDGRMARHYVRRARLTVGVDPDFGELVFSRGDYLKDAQATVRLVQGRAEALPFADRSFEWVLLGWSL